MEVIGNMQKEGLHSDQQLNTTPEPEKIMIKGLDNLGNTCYLNCCLQSLYATEEFRDYLFQIKSPSKSLHKSLRQLFKQMNSNNNNKSVEPKEFWKTFTEFKPQFEGREQHDAQECLRFIIDGIHEEVNKATIRRTKRNKNENKVIQNKDIAWFFFVKYIDDSYLVSLFVGQLRSTIQCTHCHNKSQSWEQFWDISLSLPEKEEKCHLFECLKLFVDEEVMDTDSMPDCSQCKEKRKSVKTLSFERLPLILVIHLKRFANNGQKIIKDVIISEKITINGCDFSLYACISHRGYSCAGGHYISHCKHSDKWFFFDDEDVTEVENMNISSLTNAYILFYHKTGITLQLPNQ